MMLTLYWFNNKKVMALVKKLVETVMVMMIVVVLKVIVMVGCDDCNCKGLTGKGWTIGSGSW